MSFGETLRSVVSDSPTSARFSPTRWRIAVGTLLVGLFLHTTTLAMTPYEKWAEELGIDPEVSYDAVRTMELDNQSFVAEERKAPGKMYSMVQIEQMRSGVIMREDLNKSYLLMPTMGMYREETLEGGMFQNANGMEFTDIERDGRDVVNGWDSTKYKVRFKDNEGKGAGFIWVADEGVPLKMDVIYSNRSMKGKRVTMTLTELNIRDQDPKWFEVPEGLKPMGVGGFGAMFGDAMKGAQNPDASTTPSDEGQATEVDASTQAQQACLAEAAQRAREKQEKAEKKRGLGRLMRSVSRTARRFGVDGIDEVTRDIYDANATAEDIGVIAEELGISEDEVEDCLAQ